MKKRIAYIGISYPLFYDYQYQAERTKNDLSDSPNPIIESPLGLMILYDELIFLCRSICPNNMRNLPYVKFVDEIFPKFYFKGALETADMSQEKIEIAAEANCWDIYHAMNLNREAIDTHTHSIRIGDVALTAKSTEERLLFDLYVFQALQKTYNMDIEFISNSRFKMKSTNGSVSAEFIEKIIIPNIPNYLSVDGPYHECMEELRENRYIGDFRRWIIEQHTNLQRPEINEMCDAVKQNIEEVQRETFKKYLDNNNGFSFFWSTSSTILKTYLGLSNPTISIADAFQGIVLKRRESVNAKSVRWQGFVVDSKEIVDKFN